MPFASEKQRRFIYAAASRGEAWAKRFIRDSGHTPPEVRKHVIRKAMKRG